MATYLIVSCSNRKRAVIPDELRMRSVPHGDDRVERWIERLEGSGVPARRAVNLYGGEHWQVAVTLPDVMSGPSRLLVASAGYGLVDLDARLKPYSATLTTGNADSVTEPVARGELTARLVSWWNAIQVRSHESTGTIADVVAGDPDPHVVIVASPSYVAALEDELVAVATDLGDDRVTIISAGSLGQSRVAHLAASLTASIEHHPELAGTRAALNVNAARDALIRLDGRAPTYHNLNAILTKESESLGPPRTWNRRPHTDDEVKAWIRHRLVSAPEASRTHLLERFRSEGRACEQKRFAGLFAAVDDDRQGRLDEGAA